MAANPGLEQPDEYGRHEGVVVRDVEADHLFILEVSAEARRELRPVGPLHDEDDVCPFDEFGRARDVGIRAEPGRCDLEVWAAREDLLGRWTPEPIAAAQEQDAAHARP